MTCKYAHLEIGRQTPLLWPEGVTAQCEQCRNEFCPGKSLNTVYEGHRDEGVLVVDVFRLIELTTCPKCEFVITEILFPCAGHVLTHVLFDAVTMIRVEND